MCLASDVVENDDAAGQVGDRAVAALRKARIRRDREAERALQCHALAKRHDHLVVATLERVPHEAATCAAAADSISHRLLVWTVDAAGCGR